MIEAPTLSPGTRVNDVEARLQVIEDIEAVKKAMFRYYRCLENRGYGHVPELGVDPSSQPLAHSISRRGHGYSLAFTDRH